MRPQKYSVNDSVTLYSSHVAMNIHVFGKCTPLEDQSYGVNNGSVYGTVHVATLTYVQSQVRALCHVRRTSCMGTQHAHRAVVKKNTSAEDTCNNTEVKHRVHKACMVNKISGLQKHVQQQLK